MCAQCGAPFDVPIHGGLVQCRYCSAQSQIAARPGIAALAAPGAPARSEAERLSLLREQQSRRMLPPPSLAHLFGPDCEPLPGRGGDLRAAWQSARERTRAGAADAADELEFLDLILGNELVGANELEKHRAMLESALEVFFLPRHRSVVAAELCVAACRHGDVEGGKAWLALADPAIDDLYADSWIRSARAALAQIQRDWQGVIDALGRSGAETPAHDAHVCSIAVIRANAYEELGQVDRAVAELVSQMQLSDDDRRSVTARAADYGGACATSLPRALETLRARQARASSGEMLTKVVIVVVVLGALAAVGVLIALAR